MTSRQHALDLLRNLNIGDKIWWNRRREARVAGTVVMVFEHRATVLFTEDKTPTQNRCVSLKSVSRRTE